MSSRANPEVVKVLDRPMAARAGASSFVMDSRAALRGKTCEVIVTDIGQANASAESSSGVWVLEAALCEV
ncbi:hypothetical protein CLV80_104321 [Yoonia maritima]|uniref:Uncharacterized protein n=1 Tax=Yoonia maritima TaxID=1435347 RepID=A0A2T0W0J9_9RHOB|nr:hypothetical protein [Yoonia maritima]PRY78352.1 hypothetical protein CLV80_104321 [Yoonia maritima]